MMDRRESGDALDAELARRVEAEGWMAAALVELENHPGHRLLVTVTPTGRTAERWASARDLLAGLWQDFGIYQAVVATARAVRAGLVDMPPVPRIDPASALPEPAEHPVLATHESFHRLLRRATDSDPLRRFDSADEMSEQLSGVLREVLAAEDGRPRPALSTIFGLPRGTFAAGLLLGPSGLGRPDPARVRRCCRSRWSTPPTRPRGSSPRRRAPTGTTSRASWCQPPSRARSCNCG
jgi:hypothetical protein